MGFFIKPIIIQPVKAKSLKDATSYKNDCTHHSNCHCHILFNFIRLLKDFVINRVCYNLIMVNCTFQQIINYEASIYSQGVLDLFKGEKTVTFWIGLIILGYSIYQFCLAGWQAIYYNLIYPALMQQISGISGNSSYDPSSILSFQSLLTAIPGLIGGVIFLIIGLYIMKVGIKKDQPLPES